MAKSASTQEAPEQSSDTSPVETTEEAAAPAVNLSTIPAGTDAADVVKPVALAKELNVAPQIVFGFIRNGGLQSYKDEKGKNVILRSDFDQWNAGRAEKKAAREAAKAEKAAKEAAAAAKAEAPQEVAPTS